jgi:hypothetical protein
MQTANAMHATAATVRLHSWWSFVCFLVHSWLTRATPAVTSQPCIHCSKHMLSSGGDSMLLKQLDVITMYSVHTHDTLMTYAHSLYGTHTH